MGTFDRQIDTALKLIKANGRLISVTQSIPGAYNPATGATAAATTSTISMYAITPPVSQQSKMQSFGITYVDQESIISRERLFVVAAAKDASFVPDKSDKVTIDGNDYSIAGVTPLSINGEDIIYKFGVFR